jgi:DNA-binding winged helix-turn-helix (wHTH) protein
MGQRYEFVEFILDPREGLLLRSNEPVKATPRLLDLLEALSTRSRLVEKRGTSDRVWEAPASAKPT